MTITVELDDGTATTLHEALTTHASTDHIAIYLADGDAELVIGFRGDRGMCYWHTSNADDDQVSTRGDNTEPVLYGWTEILIAAGSEIPRHDVLAAAREFAETGQQPAAISWMPYLQAGSE